MALPKKYKPNINTIQSLQGKERRKELFDMIDDNGTNFPKGVLHEDLDLGFKKFVENDLELEVDGEKVPVIIMGIQGWNEYRRTWKLSDSYGNIKIPFINIVRKPETKLSEDRMLIYNTPDNNITGRKKYPYKQIPKWDGNKKTIESYMIPEPIPIKIDYDVYFFSYRQKELNKLNKQIIKMFDAPPVYINVNGHYIPLTLEDVSDESKLQDIEDKRFYRQRYSISLEGIILDPDEFEIVELSELKISFVPNLKK